MKNEFDGLGEVIESQLKGENERFEAKKLESEIEQLAHPEGLEKEVRNALLDKLKVLLREKLGNKKEKWFGRIDGYIKEKVKVLGEIEDAKNLALDIKFSENPKNPEEYLAALVLGVRVPKKDGSEGFGQDAFDHSGGAEEQIFEALKRDDRFNPELLDKTRSNLHRQALIKALVSSLDSAYLRAMMARDPKIADRVRRERVAIRKELLKYPRLQGRPY